MFDLSDQQNEWIVVELRLCRGILGISQRELAKMTGISLQTVKRLEKKGGQPRYTTINKLRRTFEDLGVHCNVEKEGAVFSLLAPELVTAINQGRIREYIEERMYLFGHIKENYEESK